MKVKAVDIFEYSLAALLLAALVMALILSRRDQNARCCSRIEVSVTDSLRLMDDEQIIGFVRETYGECVGLRLDSIDLKAVERALESRSAVLDSQVWSTPDGVMHIELNQRMPVIRFQGAKAKMYADASGCIFPLESAHPVQVPVVDGAIPIEMTDGFKGEVEDERGRLWMNRMLDLAKYMSGTVWEENISQINVLKNGDLVMIPREGREVFVFGEPTDIAGKFGRMEKYYTHILPDKGKGYYGRVSVKYKGQIICTQ